MTQQLLPCPFCGSDSIVLWDGFGTQADIVCEECGCERSAQVRDVVGVHELFDEESCRFSDSAIDRVNEYLINEWNSRLSPVSKSFAKAIDDIKDLRMMASMDATGGSIEVGNALDRVLEILNRALRPAQGERDTKAESGDLYRCHWQKCSNRARCMEYGSCVAAAQRKAIANGDFPSPSHPAAPASQATLSEEDWQPINTKPRSVICEERGLYTHDGDELFYFKATHWRPASAILSRIQQGEG